MSQDSQDLDERVSEILNDAESSSGSLLGDEGGESDGADLLETAREASDLLESADPDELLAAVGLDTLPDGSEPDSIPQAIAQGDPEQVADLQRLLHLSNLADGDDESTLEGAVDDLRASIGDDEEAAADGDADESEAGGDDSDAEGNETDADTDESEDAGLIETVLGSGDGGRSGDAESSADAEGTVDDAESEDEGGAREAIESAADPVGAASGLDDVLESDDEGDDDETEPDEGADIGDRLRSAVESSLTDVGDDLEGLHERLQERSASSVGGESDDETADDAEDEEDDGVLGSGLGGGEGRGTSSGSGTRHSTMAPPPSKRADMRTTRHSTMPDKH